MKNNLLFMSINLKPHSLECGSSFGVLDFGSQENPMDFLCRKNLLKFFLASRKPLNKPHTLVCGKLKVFLMYIFFIINVLSLSIAQNQMVDLTYSYLNSSSVEKSVDYSNFLIKAYTPESSLCKYSTAKGVPYSFMEGNFDLTSGKYHEKGFYSLNDGFYRYYIKCFSNIYNVSEPAENELVVRVDSFISSRIVLSKEAPLKAGKVELTLITSKFASQTPILTYSFDSVVYNDIPLYGSEKNWKGYLLIPKSLEQAIVSFKFKAYDMKGRLGQEITNGNIFIIDNTKPKIISIINAIGYSGKIKLDWYSEGENKEFNIYKSISPNPDYTNLYKTVQESPFEDFFVEKGKTYYYRISGLNEAGVEGDLSKEISATVLLDNFTNPTSNSGLNIELRGYVDNTITDIDSFINDIEQIKGTISLKEEKEKNIFNNIRLDKELENSKSELVALKKEVEKYKSQDLSKDELNKKLDSSKLKINIIRKKVPENIVIISQDSNSEELDEKKVENSILEIEPSVLESVKKRNTKESLKYIKESGFKIKNNYYIIEIVYLDGTKKDISIIEKSIDATLVNIENLSIFEIIPKELAESVSEINLLNLDYKTIKEDPIVSFSSDTKKIIYYFNKRTSLDSLKKTKTSLLYNDFSENLKDSGFNITGYFSLVSSNYGYMGIIIGLILFLSLLLYFLYMVKKKKLILINSMLERVREGIHYIEIGDKHKAEAIYNFISSDYSNLAMKEKEKIYGDLMILREKISLFKIKTSLEIAGKTKNKNLFKSIEKVYIGLSETSKKEIYLLFEKTKADLGGLDGK